jgi:hypothetical protein
LGEVDEILDDCSFIFFSGDFAMIWAQENTNTDLALRVGGSGTGLLAVVENNGRGERPGPTSKRLAQTRQG